MQFKTLAGAAALTLLAGASTQALAASTGSFDNGNFENGTLSGWDVGGGYWYGGSYPQPGNYYPGSGGPVTVTSAGTDSHTGGALSTVYGGNHSVKVNDDNNDYSVAVIRQQVNNYTDTQIAFAYAAVLESSHGPSDSDAFIITLEDLTTSTVLYSYNLNSATAPGKFNLYQNHWYWTPWQTVTVAVTAGHDYMLSLLANDCPYGGHAGYAYLDGFGSVAPPPGPTPGVPEPATWALMIAGFGMVGATLRRRQALAA